MSLCPKDARKRRDQDARSSHSRCALAMQGNAGHAGSSRATPRMDLLDVLLCTASLREVNDGQVSTALQKKGPYRTRTHLIHGNPDSKREEITAHQVVYGCTHSLLTNWLTRTGIRTRFVDLTAPCALCKTITHKTRVVYFETPVNPTLQLIDIAAIRSVLDKVNQGHGRHIRIITRQHACRPLMSAPI